MTIGEAEDNVRRLVHRLDARVALDAAGIFCIRRTLRLVDEILSRTGRRLGHREVRRQRCRRAVTGLGRALGSSKHQAPSTKEAPSTKHQKADSDRHLDLWSLKFGASLELGAWSLELFPCLVLFRSHRLIRQRQRQNSAVEKIIHLPRARSRITENRVRVCAINVLVALSRN